MSHETRMKIDAILQRIRVSPEYSASVNSQVMNSLIDDANRHSVAIEAKTDGRKTQEEIDKFESESLDRIVNAREYLRNNGLNLGTLSQLGKKIEPDINLANYFRIRDVAFGPNIGGAIREPEFKGAKREEIPGLISDLLERVNEKGESFYLHPLQKASDIHLSIVKIHPYGDGNGRCARLVEDFYLESMGIPPATIPENERELYINLIEKAIRSRVNGISSVYAPDRYEQNFSNFIDDKVLANTLRLEEELKNNRKYLIKFGKIDTPGQAQTIKKILAGYNGHSATVRLERTRGSKTFSYTVTGDLSLEEIAIKANCVKDKYKVRLVTCERKLY